MRVIEARYEEGVLRPREPLPLRSGESVNLIVVRQPDPNRWDLDKLRAVATTEELELVEQGMADWANALDREDRG